MSVASGNASAVTSLLAAIADPAVALDGAGCVQALNAAARERLGLSEDAIGQPVAELLGARLASGRRIALADDAGALTVWSLDDHGLGPDDIALEKLSIIERISGPVSHEIKNAIGPQRGFADLALGDPALPEDLRQLGLNAMQAGDEATALTVAMFEFSRDESVVVSSLAEIARGILALLKAPALSMERRVAIPDGLPEVAADASTLRQVLLAVVLNALEAQGTRWVRGADGVPGRLLISARHIDDARGNRVRIAVQDKAATMPVAERATLFRGSGIGRASRDLMVARALVQRAGGRISHEWTVDGNRIVVELPLAGAPALPELDPEAQPEPEPPPLVLVCDPMPLIRTLLVRFLGRLRVRAVEARDGQEALQILGREPVSMVIADLGLDAGGSDLYDSLVVARPDLATRFVLITADPGGSAEMAFVARTGVPALGKPFDNARLGELVREMLGL